MSLQNSEKYLLCIFQIQNQCPSYIKSSYKSICKRQILWLTIPLPEIHSKQISLEVAALEFNSVVLVKKFAFLGKEKEFYAILEALRQPWGGMLMGIHTTHHQLLERGL